MTWFLNVRLVVSDSDGDQISDVAYGASVFNPTPEDYGALADLAGSRASTLADRVVQDTKDELGTWAQAANRIVRDARRSPLDPARIRTQIKEQDGRCPYHADEDPAGALEPGDPVALALDGTTVLHLACAEAGAVPEGDG